MTESPITALDLNYAKGFKDTSLDFLQEWPIRKVSLLARTAENLDPLYQLSPTLEELRIQSSPRAKLDLNRLPALRQLGASWSQIKETISDAKSLLSLFVLSYSEADFEPLRWNEMLRSVRLKEHTPLESIRGIQALAKLEELEINLAKRLSEIGPLEDLPEPELVHRLQFVGCRVRQLDPVSGCTQLEFLNVSENEDVESVAPLRNLTSLTSLWMYGSTKIIDGDLTPLTELPALRDLRLQSRRTYQPPLKQVISQMGP